MCTHQCGDDSSQRETRTYIFSQTMLFKSENIRTCAVKLLKDQNRSVKPKFTSTRAFFSKEEFFLSFDL